VRGPGAGVSLRAPRRCPPGSRCPRAEGTLDGTAVMAAVVGYQRVLSRTRAGVPDDDSNAKPRRGWVPTTRSRDILNSSNNTRATAWDLVVGCTAVLSAVMVLCWTGRLAARASAVNRLNREGLEDFAGGMDTPGVVPTGGVGSDGGGGGVDVDPGRNGVDGGDANARSGGGGAVGDPEPEPEGFGEPGGGTSLGEEEEEEG